jgi:flagellar assembly protein FliH
MHKAVFRPGEVEVTEVKVVLDPPTSFPELSHLANSEAVFEDFGETIEEYSGPTVEDLRREAEEYRIRWESEKEALLNSAKTEAEQIIQEAEETAFKQVKRKTDEIQAVKRQAQDEAEQIIAEANEKARQIEEDSRNGFEAERKVLEEEGRTKGRDAGFAEGKAEVERLIQRTQLVLQRAQDKRTEILEETEQEIINLVLLISRKVVKAISESQRDVILNNVVQALRKVKGKGNIIIRVNTVDLKLTTANIQNFINRMEGVQNIQVMEDPSVDQGGCIIETDFGEIDARIASQLAELEAKILELSPIKSKAKSPPGN